MSLLICEDDPLIALDLSEEAERRAVGEVVVVANADDALRAIDNGAFSAAIVDLHLEDGRSGPRIARRLAERGVRTIILSGGELDCAELADAAHVFIRKPTPADIVIDCARVAATPDAA
ncbi:MAG TPA: response regulator [Rhodoblastus sp.]|nr:response regulator [Rhodoblastus sp.]